MMAARSARIESTNIGAIGSALQSGTDLVIMTTMPQCCKLCGAYQDKVYSISGKDKRFPALFKTVLKSGYALPHPNCRHEFIPYYLDIESDEDIQKAIAKSKIKYGITTLSRSNFRVFLKIWVLSVVEPTVLRRLLLC